jgi:prepilin-type N-terminal cleavage/methylation domain-containing protein
MLRNRKGVTLFEIMTVMVITAIVMVVAVPRVGSSRHAAAMAAARTQVESYLATTRAIATRNGGRTQLVRSGNTLTIQADTGTGYVTMVKPMQIDASSNITLGGTATAPIAFDARGIASGLNASGEKFYLTVSSGYGAGMKDSVCITRFGAVLDRNCGATVSTSGGDSTGGGGILPLLP